MTSIENGTEFPKVEQEINRKTADKLNSSPKKPAVP